MRKITNNKYNYEVNSDKTSGYSTINDHVLDEILNYDGENKIDNILNGEIEIGENDLFPPIVKIIKLTLDYKEIELNTARAKLFTQNEFSNKNIIYKTVEETNIELLLNRDLFYKSNEESYEPVGNVTKINEDCQKLLDAQGDVLKLHSVSIRPRVTYDSSNKPIIKFIIADEFFVMKDYRRFVKTNRAVFTDSILLSEILNNWDSINRDLTRSTLTIYGFKEDK